MLIHIFFLLRRKRETLSLYEIFHIIMNSSSGSMSKYNFEDNAVVCYEDGGGYDDDDDEKGKV